LINLIADLGRTRDAAAARATIERAGMRVVTTEAVPERVLAWIDDVFSGAWSSEAFVSVNVVAWRGETPVGFACVDGREMRYAWLRGVARDPGVGLFGPFGVAPAERGSVLGPALLTIALEELRQRGYRQALIAATSDRLVSYYEHHAGAREVERFDRQALMPSAVRTVVLASGSGTNFQAVVDGVTRGLPLELAGLVSNRSQAYALERARVAGIPAVDLTWSRSQESREAYDRRLYEAVRAYDPKLVLLLGWMHLLSPAFVESFPDMLNVHPAYLPLDPARDDVVLPDGTTMPAFRGAHAVADALALQTSWVGASVHAVTVDTDRGAILMRKPLRIHSDETESAVLQRLHPIEHGVVEGAIRRWLFMQ
jgi:phosphoribosylglycinamide formyltransferase 1